MSTTGDHSGTPEAEAPDMRALGRLVDEVASVTDLVADAVAALTAEDMRVGLSRMNPGDRQQCLDALRLPSAGRRLPDLLCSQAATRLKRSSPRVQMKAAYHLTQPFCHYVATHAAEYLRGASGDSGAVPPIITDTLMRSLTDDLLKAHPQGLVRLSFAWHWDSHPFCAAPMLRALMTDERLTLGSWSPLAEAVVATTDADQPVLEEGFLARVALGDDAAYDQRGAAHDLREAEEYPVVHAGTSDALDVHDRHDLDGGEVPGAEHGMHGHDEGGAERSLAGTHADVPHAALLVGEVRAALAAARKAAAAALEAVRGDRAPDDDDLDALHDVTRAFHAAHEAFDLEVPPPVTLARLDAVLADLQDDGTLRNALGALALATGPAFCAPSLEALVADAARLGTTDPWSEEDGARARVLGRFVELVGAAARNDDEEVFSLDAELRYTLGEEAAPVILAATQGRIVIPDEPSSAHNGGATPTDLPVLDTAVSSDLETAAQSAASLADATAAPDDATEPASEAAERPVDVDEVTAGPSEAPEVPSETVHAIDAETQVVADAQQIATTQAETTELGESEELDGSHMVDQELGALLGVARFAVAAWLAQATGSSLGRVDALRATALAHALRSPTGTAITELNTVAARLSRHDLEGDRAAQVLTLVAAMRTVLLVPRSGMLSVVSDLGEVFAAESGLGEIAGAVAHAATRGLTLSDEFLPAAQGVAEVEALVRRAVEAAAAEIGTPRTIRFQRATRIWQRLVGHDGVLAQLLGPVAANDVRQRPAVEAAILSLRARHGVDSLLDDLDQRLRGHGSKRLEGPARRHLVDLVAECADVAAAWVEATGRLESVGRQAGDWRQAPLGELRDVVCANRERALSTLGAMRLSEEHVLRGAAGGAAMMLEAVFSLLDGVAVPGTEPDVAAILNGDLLKAPEVALDDHGDVVDPDAVTVGAVLGAAERTWEEGFEARCAAGDFGVAGAIIERVAEEMPAEADVLRALHHERLAVARTETEAETALVRAEADTARRRGFLDENSWRDVTVVLDQAKMASRVDLGAVARELAAVKARCAERRVLELATFTEEYAAKRAAPGVAERTEEIDRLVELGDLATARDVIARAEIGDEPPALAETPRALAEFFPALPSAVPGGLDPRHIAEAGAGGAIAGVSFAGLSLGERNVAKRGLQAWYDVTTKERSSSWVVPLAPALRILGIEADSSRNPALPGGADRRWVDFTGVRRTGKALVPAFGSATRNELRALLCWNSPEVTTLLGWIAQDASEKPVVVLYFATLSPERRLTLATVLRERRGRPVVIVDDAALLYLAAYGASRFDATMRLVLPFSAVNPYEPYAAGEVPVEMFYGRSLERSSITDQRGTSLIYGGRQLGKSALLRSAAGRFEQTRGYRALYVTLQSAPIATTKRPEAVWEVLKEALNISEFTTRRLPKKDAAAVVEELIEGWLAADASRRLLLLLDECDDFFDADAEHGFSHTARLRDLMARTGRRVKAVFAGLHQVQRFASIPNQPLAHLGEPQVIGPLAPQPAFDLLHGPLEALGFRLGEAQAARLMANANYQPLALQLYGRALLSLMLGKTVTDSLPVDVTDAAVDAVLRNPTLDEQIRQCFELTLRLDPRYRVIAYTVAYRAQEAGHDSAMTTRELRAECETWWKEGFAQLGPDEFRSLVEEMVGLGVLAMVPDGWRMRSPNVLRMLGGIERVEEVLAEAESQPAPSGLFAAETRRVLDPDCGRRSPLTEMQLAELVSSATGRTHVVLGSPACGVEDVRDALAAAAASVGRAQLREAKSKATYRQLLRSGEPGEHRIVVSVLDAKDESCEAALEAALSTPPAEKTVRSVILVAGSQNLSWWPAVLEHPNADVEVTELRRHSPRSLWVWAVEVPSAFQDDQSRIRLLTITGGWPVLIDRAAQLAREGCAQPEIFAALEADLGTVAGAARLVDAVGLDADEELTVLWHVLDEAVDEPVTFEDLVALADTNPHPAGAVDALRALGVLAVTATGTLHPEPVFRAAWHRIN